MLLNNLFTVASTDHAPGVLKASIRVQKDHQIFQGHFPGHPVVPGVCMIQMVKELLQTYTRQKLNIVAGDTIKFLSIINPEQHEQIQVEIQYTEATDKFLLNAVLFAGDVTFFKFKGAFQHAS